MARWQELAEGLPGARRAPDPLPPGPGDEDPSAATAVVDVEALPERPGGPEHIQAPALEVEQRRVPDRYHAASAQASPFTGDRVFFLAERQSDGTYSVSLTEEGVQTFETALGIADDLGGRSRISPHSTIGDIMERTATREELSSVMREGGEDFRHRLRLSVLRRKLRGTEKPSARQVTISHIGKALIVAVFAVWALQQFVIAVQDIASIPGILAGIPSDIINFHPTSAFGDVGNAITDAGVHVLLGVLIACLTFLVAELIHPFARIYRQDQLVPGERRTLRLVNFALRRYAAMQKRRQAPQRV